MASDKIILKAEDLDGYLTRQDKLDLDKLKAMYDEAIKSFDPLDEAKVINIIHKTPNIPITCVELNPITVQVEVLSDPVIAVESGTHILDEVLTNHITYEKNHIKVPTNAYLGPTLLAIQE